MHACGVESFHGVQGVGVCQGCPLSPFLFGVFMTILITDAYKSLPASRSTAHEQHRLDDILYADDTLLLAVDPHHVEALAVAVEAHGAQYGLSLH